MKEYLDCLYEPLLLEEYDIETGKIKTRQFDFDRVLKQPVWKNYRGVPYYNKRLMKIEFSCDIDSYYRIYNKEYLSDDEKPFSLSIIATIPQFLVGYKGDSLPENIERRFCDQFFIYLQDDDCNFETDYSDHLFVLREVDWKYTIKNNILLYLDVDENNKIYPAWRENLR